MQMHISLNSNSFLPQLIHEVSKGKLLPASFQRPYRWEREDILKFWTSIVRGYPIGAFLLWQPAKSPDLSRYGRPRLGPIMP